MSPSLKKLFTFVGFLNLFYVGGAHCAPPTSDYLLLYQDEFNDNVLNEEDWYYRASDVVRFGGYSQKENVSVITRDGIGFLNLAYTRNDINGDGVEDPVSGGVISKKAFGYGYYEARIKFYDDQPGLHQSFWTVGIGYYTSYNEDYGYNEDALFDRVPYVNSVVEIDIVELDSKKDKGSANFHWHTPSFQTLTGAKKSFSSSFIDTSKWITFGMEWTPGQVVIWVDGVERHRIAYTDDRYGAQQVWLTALANNRVEWGGNGYPAADASMKVDYFRFYGRPIEANLVANPGFEHNKAATSSVRNWISDDGIYNNIYTDQAAIFWNDGNAHTGLGYLQHSGQGGAPVISSRMELEFIANGFYRASAWVQRSQNVASAKMRATGYGGEDREINLPLTDLWTEIFIYNIKVTNNRLDLSFSSSGGNDTWIRVDDVKVIYKEAEENSPPPPIEETLPPPPVKTNVYLPVGNQSKILKPGEPVVLKLSEKLANYVNIGGEPVCEIIDISGNIYPTEWSITENREGALLLESKRNDLQEFPLKGIYLFRIWLRFPNGAVSAESQQELRIFLPGN